MTISDKIEELKKEVEESKKELNRYIQSLDEKSSEILKAFCNKQIVFLEKESALASAKFESYCNTNC